MKRLFAVLAILCGNLFGQSIIAPASTVNGVPASNLITICSVNPGSGTCAGGNLVTTYTTFAISVSCSGTNGPLSGSGCSNPGYSDSFGNIIAFAAGGQYWCQYKASSVSVAYSLPCSASAAAGGGGTTINPTNNVLPVRSNATTFIDTPLIFSNGSTTAARGISFTDPTITQGGTPGTTVYIYCVVATDVFTNTRSTCFNTALGAATLNSTNFNTITVGAYTATSPYIQPTGSCNVYRIVSNGTPSSLGKIGTIASCASGGSLNDTGLAGDATTVPVDTSGVINSVGPANIGQVYIYSDEVGMFLLGGVAPGSSLTNVVTAGYTHSVIVGGGSGVAYANSGITAVGWNGQGSAHACTAIGYGINCNTDSGFLAGISAGSTGGGSGAVAILGTTTNGNEVVVGNASTAGGESVAIGHNASCGFTNSVCLGRNATATAINQIVIGGSSATDFYAGNISSGNSTASYHALSGQLSGNWNCFNVTPVTVSANVSTDQNLMACSVPAGILSRVGAALRIHTKSVYTTPAASTATLNFKAKLCDTSGCGSGNVATLVSIISTANAGSITNDPILFDVESTTQQAGGTSRYEASGDLLIDLAATTTAAVTVFNDTNTAVIAGAPSDVNLNNATFLQITVAFSAASGSNSVTERQLIVDSVN